MTVSVTDCIQPEGELFGALFPDNNLEDLVSGWLTKGVARVAALGIAAASQDDAVIAYVYWRAYDQISLRMANEFASKTVHSGAGDATIAQTNDQRKFMQDRAQYWYDRFNEYGGGSSDGESTGAVFFSNLPARFNGDL